MQSLSSGGVGDYRSMLASASGPSRSIATPGFFVSGVSMPINRNELASTYLLPVIDAGVRAGATADGPLSGLTVGLRLLTAARGYVAGVFGAPVPSVGALTMIGARDGDLRTRRPPTTAT
jgi:hypothetical protein